MSRRVSSSPVAACQISSPFLPEPECDKTNLVFYQLVFPAQTSASKNPETASFENMYKRQMFWFSQGVYSTQLFIFDKFNSGAGSEDFQFYLGLLRHTFNLLLVLHFCRNNCEEIRKVLLTF